MLILYGDFVLTFGITSSPGSSSGLSRFLTSSDAMKDGRSGLVASIEFDTGAAALTQYTELTVAVSSPLDTSPPWGAVGLVNVQGLPEGTKCTFNGVTQRLSPNEFGELCAWWIPNGLTGAGPNSIKIYNDVNGSHTITPGATFGVGEIIVGRILSIKTMANQQPSADVIDTTVDDVTPGGQLHRIMRKPRRTITAKLGPFLTADAKGKATSSLVSGANPAGVIDVATLRGILLKSPVFAVCDTPSAGRGAGTTVNGITFDQQFMQQSWMLARPLSLSSLTYDMPPKWTLSAQFQEAT